MDIPTIEPTGFTQGVTVKWTKDLTPDYPASQGWTLAYSFRKENGTGAGADALEKTAVASGDAFAVTLSTADTNGKTVGKWIWTAFISKSGERYQVDSGSLVIKQDLSQVTSAYDGRSDAKKALDNATAIWQGVTLEKSYTIDGRVWTSHDMAEIILMKNRAQTDYNDELAAERATNGQGTGRKIKVRFSKPK